MDLQLSVKKHGFVTLTSVLILGVVALAVTTTILTVSTDLIINSETIVQSDQSKALADTCAELALNELKKDTGYTGNQTLNLGEGSCEILTVQGSGNTTRTIQAEGNIEGVIRRVVVEVDQVNPDTQISSWQEVADF